MNAKRTGTVRRAGVGALAAVDLFDEPAGLELLHEAAIDHLLRRHDLGLRVLAGDLVDDALEALSVGWGDSGKTSAYAL